MPAVLRTPHVLLCDDDPFMVQLSTAIIQKAFGSRLVLHGVTNAAEAQLALRQHVYDLVIASISMPELNGRELLELSKQYHPWSQVVFIAEQATWDHVVQMFECGAVDYLLKPIDPGELIAIVQQAYARIMRWQVTASRMLDTIEA